MAQLLAAAGIPLQESRIRQLVRDVERGRAVQAFQSGDGVFFLLSLKAGAFGMNLTAADYVIIADPWWNPAVEDQAAGRAHRMGQQRPVTVYRLVVKDSVEFGKVLSVEELTALLRGE